MWRRVGFAIALIVVAAIALFAVSIVVHPWSVSCGRQMWRRTGMLAVIIGVLVLLAIWFVASHPGPVPTG